MPKSERAQKLAQSVLAQLNAEITAAGTDVKSVAARMGSDYNTIRRYLIGERKLPMGVLWEIADAISLDPTTLIARAKERAGE